jgi:AAA domain
MTAERAVLDDFNAVPSGPLKPIETLAEDLDALKNRGQPSSTVDVKRLIGLTFAEARRAEIPARNELVGELVDAGTVGLIAGLPFARKSWAALELAHKVAAGGGQVFGRFEIVKPGPVLYVWQDDSMAKELERIQRYAVAHDYPDDLPLRFLLNEDVRLPDDIDPLAEMAEREGAVLVVVDSLYNALSPTVKLKDEEVSVVLAQIKTGLCDRTGTTVGLVDHAPWPTEGNRGQRRAYGSVFKTAAVRWSIHLEADAKDDTSLHVEASGNNVAGFRRTPARWDEDALEIRLVDVQATPDDAELDERVRAYVESHPGASQNKVEDGVEGSRNSIRKSLTRQSEPGELQSLAVGPGRHSKGKYYFPVGHAGLNSPGELQATLGDIAPGASQGQVSPDSPAPRGGASWRATPWTAATTSTRTSRFERLSICTYGSPASATPLHKLGSMAVAGSFPWLAVRTASQAPPWMLQPAQNPCSTAKTSQTCRVWRSLWLKLQRFSGYPTTSSVSTSPASCAVCVGDGRSSTRSPSSAGGSSARRRCYSRTHREPRFR